MAFDRPSKLSTFWPFQRVSPAATVIMGKFRLKHNLYECMYVYLVSSNTMSDSGNVR